MLDLYARFAPFFPIGDGLARLELVEADASTRARHEGVAIVVVRLIVFEYDANRRPMIRDIKEQELRCGAPALYADATRVDEMLHAQREVLGELLGGSAELFETLMPVDLVHTDVLTLARAHNREDFARALRAKSRLGKLLERHGR